MFKKFMKSKSRGGKSVHILIFKHIFNCYRNGKIFIIFFYDENSVF